VKKSANAIVVPMGDDLCPGTHFKIQKKEVREEVHSQQYSISLDFFFFRGAA
jgi:hypothetical protein